MLHSIGEWLGKFKGMEYKQIQKAVMGIILLGAGLSLFAKGGTHPLALAVVIGLGAIFMTSALGTKKKGKTAQKPKTVKRKRS